MICPWSQRQRVPSIWTQFSCQSSHIRTLLLHLSYTRQPSIIEGYRQKCSMWWHYTEKWFVLIVVSSILSVRVNDPYRNFIVNSQKITATTLYWVLASGQGQCSYTLFHFHDFMKDYSSFTDNEKFNNLPKVTKSVNCSRIQTQAVNSKVLQRSRIFKDENTEYQCSQRSGETSIFIYCQW